MKTIPVILITLYASAAQAATPAVVQSKSCMQIRVDASIHIEGGRC